MTVDVATRVAMVWPPLALVNRGVSPLRAEPDDRAELVDEAQHFEGKRTSPNTERRSS